MLRARVLSAVVLAPIILLLVYFGGIPWLLAVLVVGCQAWRELSQLLQRDHFAVDFVMGLFFVLATILEAYLHASSLIRVDFLRPLLAALIIFSLIWATYNKGEHPTADWGVTVASAIYLGFLLSHFVVLRERADGLRWVVMALALPWIIDASAYFVGTAIGKHALWPRISPKKTWEGLIGGSVAVMIAAPFLAHWLLGLNPWLGLLLGFLAALLDPFGDFAVSLFKRRAMIKDSSQLIPGHGGVLDRLDSLLFVFPLVTYFALLVSG